MLTTWPQETHENVICLEDDEPEAVAVMLYYLYHSRYDSKSTINRGAEEGLSPMLLHVLVFTIADKYFLSPLKQLAAERFAECAQNEWRTSAFAESISEIYNTAPAHDESLRDIAISTSLSYLNELAGATDTYKAFNDVVDATPAFAAALFRVQLADAKGQPKVADIIGPKPVTWYRCPGICCQKDDVIFAVGRDVAQDRSISCPSGCNRSRQLSWWEEHRI